MLSTSPDVRPIPDPTALTLQLVFREISALERIINSKLDAIAKATELLQRASDRVPSEVDQKIANLHDLQLERISALNGMMDQQIMRVEQSLRDRRMAVEAMVNASKEAVGIASEAAKEAAEKTERNFIKMIDQLGVQTQTESRALDSKITEVKDRLDAGIGTVSARAEAAISALRAELLPQITGERSRGDRGEGRQLGQGALIALILAGMSILVGIVTVIGFVLRFAKV